MITAIVTGPGDKDGKNINNDDNNNAKKEKNRLIKKNEKK